MRQARPSFRPWPVPIVLLLLALLAPAAGATPRADVPGTPCQQGGWVWMARADTPDIAFLSEDACTSAIAEGVQIVPITIPPDGPPPIGSAICGSDYCYTIDRDSDGVPDFRDAAPDDPNVTISADCQRAMGNGNQQSFANANLASCDLHGRVLVDLSGANLSGANLTDAYLAGANLSGANFTGANLTGAFLNTANLSGAYLTRADLARAFMSGANFTGAFLVQTNGSNARLPYADLTRAFMFQATLAGANLEEANLTQANLTGVDLRGANLFGADLTRANLTGATADQTTNLWEVIWEMAVCPSGNTNDSAHRALCHSEFYMMDPY